MDDKLIIAGRRVNLDPTHPIDKIVMESMPIYDNSVEMACELCEEPILIGPRQQQKLAEVDCDVLCHNCVIATAHRTPFLPWEVRSLDNPQGNLR